MKHGLAGGWLGDFQKPFVFKAQHGPHDRLVPVHSFETPG
jgi:hypothetical protein